MRCRNCDYALWNLRARTCPECGTDFQPSDFEFITNSVRFCCPHCDQQYYGTTHQGHLYPASFDCVKCGQRVHMDQMVLRPALDVSEEQTSPYILPWLHRRELGFARGWFGTIGAALVRPGDMMRAGGADTRLGAAFGFALLTQTVIWLTFGGVFVVLAIFGALRGSTNAAGMLVTFVGVPWLISIVSIVLGGLLIHGILLMGGNPRTGVRGTWAAMAYSSGANIFSAVPCIGGWIMWTWWIVSAVIAVRESQRVSSGRATCAVLAWPALLLVLFAGGTVIFTYWGVAQVQTAINSARQQNTTMLTDIGGALHEYAALHGRWPGHPLELVIDPETQLDTTFCLEFTVTNMMDVELTSDEEGGPITLLAFMTGMSELSQKELVAGLPATSGVHRLGDVVFVYEGIDVDDPPSDELWLAFTWPHPVSGGGVPPMLKVGVTRVDGTTESMEFTELLQALESQNALREAHDLPKIPAPSKIR